MKWEFHKGMNLKMLYENNNKQMIPNIQKKFYKIKRIFIRKVELYPLEVLINSKNKQYSKERGYIL